MALGEQLYGDKIINRPRVFQWLLRIEPELSHFKAGTYRFTPGMTVREMLQLLESGKEAQFPLRFVEGMRLSDYLKQLRDAPYIKHTLKDDSYQTVADVLKFEHPEWVEGWFWPDTDVHRRHDRCGDPEAGTQKWSPPWMPPGKGEWMAYPIKIKRVCHHGLDYRKETAVAAERDRVASVFINRLRIGMRLQTDPTVIYGMGENYTGKISRKDLETPTAYNTYVISGLPLARLPRRARLLSKPPRTRRKHRISILWLMERGIPLTPTLPATIALFRTI